MPSIQSRKEQNVGEGNTNMGGREMGSLDRQRRRGTAQGDSRFVWGPIEGLSQNGGRRGEENDEEKRGMNKRKMRHKGVLYAYMF